MPPMIALNGVKIRLAMGEDGTGVTIEDKVRGVVWRLDERTRLAGRESARFDCAAYQASRKSDPGRAVFPLGPGVARLDGPDSITAVHVGPGGRVSLRWTMESDRVRVGALPADPGSATGLTLPGTFRPDGEAGFGAVVPLGQGILHNGKGPSFFHGLTASGHGHGYTLAMVGQVAGKGALVAIAETEADASLHWEKTDAGGGIDLMWVQHPSLGFLSYPRETVLVPTDPQVVAVAKAYRCHVIAKGRFKSWEEKIAERPALARLFGSAVVFVGYLDDPDLDYAAAFRALKQAGIGKAYVLPVYMACAGDLGSVMGAPLADLRRHIPLLRELGYLAGSFIYITDGPDGGSLRLDAKGNPVLTWRIRDYKWFAYSAEERARWAARLLDAEHGGLDAVHYDVLCCTRFNENHDPARKYDAREDAAAIRKLLEDTAKRGLIISSEGFLDRLTPYYDIASTKYSHAVGAGEYCVVPLTALVYHDSVIHTWWEVDNYGNPEHRSQFGRGQSSRLWWGGGFPRRQAAIDALLGAPPDIFPFGHQYNFVPHRHPEIYTYKPTLSDPLVRESIECAKPVMALHERIGRLEMTGHHLVTPDGAVQETVFADGTRVVANFANVALEAPGGVLDPESWRML
jgi:hypothetical protein